MINYEPGSPDDGEVFDLTALVSELSKREDSRHHHAVIELNIMSTRDYSGMGAEITTKSEIQWSAMIDFNSSGRSGYLDDAIKASMPDTVTTDELRKRLKRAKRKVDDIEEAIRTQRLEDAAQIRHQRPVMRITESVLSGVVAIEESKQP